MDRSDIYSMFWLLLLYIYIIIVSNFVPAGPARNIAGFAGIFIVVGGMFFTDIVIRERVNKYPYVRARVQPSGKIIRFFIENMEEKKVGKTLWSLTLKLKWPSMVPGYGKVDKLVINHEYPISKRISFRPGQATWFGYVVDHPQTEFMVLYEFPSVVGVNHAEPVPVYWLKEASKDYYLPSVPLSALVRECNPTLNPQKLSAVMRLHKAVDVLKAQLAEARRAAFSWHEKAIELEERVAQQESEIKGLLEDKTNFTAAVVERLMSLLAECQTIENAIKRLKGTGWGAFTFNKWLALTVISLGTLILLYAMRGYIGTVGIWLSNPINMLFSLAVVGLFCVVLYFVLVAKTKGGK